MVAHLFASQEVIVPFGNDKVVDARFTHEPTLDFATSRVTDFLDFIR